MTEITEALEGALREAEQQIMYLHDKFSETGSGNAVLTRIRAALNQGADHGR